MIRAFVVGSPRSGTTLLQRLLAERHGLYTLPETHLVPSIVSRSAPLRRAGWARRGAAAAASDAVGRDLVVPPPVLRWRTVPVLRAALAALDEEAVERGAAGWVEKTPRHLRHLGTIERAGSARVVHIVRDGASVVASVVEVTGAHPEAWGGARTAVAAARRWRDDVAEHARWAGQPGHVIVRFEELAADPDVVLAPLGPWLGVEPVPPDEVTDRLSRDDVARAEHIWIHAASDDVTAAAAAGRAGAAASLRADPEVGIALDEGSAIADGLPYGVVPVDPSSRASS